MYDYLWRRWDSFEYRLIVTTAEGDMPAAVIINGNPQHLVSAMGAVNAECEECWTRLANNVPATHMRILMFA